MDQEIVIEWPLTRSETEDLKSMLAEWRASKRMRQVAPSQSIWVPAPVYFKNDSGEQIPAYACMQATDTEERDGQNFIVVDKPADATGEAGPFLFNGPEAVAIGDDGLAQNGSVVRMLTDGTAFSAGDKLSPEASEWAVTTGSLYPYIGEDDVEDDVVRALATSGSVDIEFQVINGDTLQYRINGGSWVTIFTLDLRLSSGNYQFIIYEGSAVDWNNWLETTTCT